MTLRSGRHRDLTVAQKSATLHSRNMTLSTVMSPPPYIVTSTHDTCSLDEPDMIRLYEQLEAHVRLQTSRALYGEHSSLEELDSNIGMLLGLPTLRLEVPEEAGSSVGGAYELASTSWSSYNCESTW